MVKQDITVLLIEDSEPEQELIKDYFELSNLGDFQILAADRLVDASELLQERSVDIVILDLGLPDSSGIETLVAVLAVADGVPVIVLTGNDDKVLGEEAIICGAQDFLAKGMGAEALLPRICYYTLQRHHLQKKVQEAETFLRNTLNSLTEHIAITDNQGTILLVNKRWERFSKKIGLDEDKSGIGFNYFALCSELHGEGSTLYETFSRKTQQVISGELPFFDLDYPCLIEGNKAWYQVRVSPFIGMGEGCLVIAHTEITDKKRIETALKRNEAYLRLIFDTTPDCVFVKDDGGRYVMANRAMAELYGCSVADMLGRTDNELLSQMQQVGAARKFMEDDSLVLSEGNTRKVEEPFVRKDGEKRWFRTVKTPIIFPDLPRYILGIASDISREREDQKKLRDSEILLRTILDAMHYNIVLLDKKLRVIWYNRAASDSMEGNKTIIGEQCANLKMSRNSCKMCNARQALETGNKVTETYRLDNDESWRISGCPIFNENGEITSVLCISENISKWLSLEQQLRQAQKMEALGTLAGGIAHDFNNILTAILGFTELSIEKTRLGSAVEALQADLSEVHKASLRAKDLVHQILTFSRKVDAEVEPLDIALIIKEALKLLRSTLPSSIRLRTNVPVNLGKILADPIHIHQIIMNLCTNASHAIGEESGELEVTLAKKQLQDADLSKFSQLKSGTFLLLQVRDTGGGIPEQNLHSIFEPYFTTKEQGEGTGLGLAVVHGIVKDIGGEILVSSIVGEGTTFSIYFPVSSNDDTVIEIDEHDDEIFKGRGEKILVVDDEAMIINLCSFILRSAGYEVDPFTDARVALERIQERADDYSLVVSDITMPYLTGDKLLLESRAIRPDLPVVLISGQAKEPVSPVVDLSREHRLKKPFTKKQLLETVWNALQGNVINRT